MKRIKSGKKIFSAIAALAISATAVGGVLSLVNRNDKVSTIDGATEGKNTVIVDTALGQTRSQTGNKYYVSPDVASGTTSATGTLENPYNINDMLSATPIQKLEAGDTLYVLPGTYKLGTKLTMPRDVVIGAYNKYIRIVNAALEEASGYTGDEKLAILDFSAMKFESTGRGVAIDTDYIYWYGIDVCGAGDNGMYIGGSYNTIEYSEFYNNRDTGLQLGRSFSEYNSIYQWPSYNLVKNCTSHNNYDNETFGENADGFAAKLTVGFGNVFDGCIAYRNSDDGWDLYAKTDSGNIGTVIIYNCVAFENGYLEYTRDECNSLFPTYDKNMPYHTSEKSTNPYMTRDGDGNGFKLGGSIMEGDVILYNCLSYNNRMHGVTDNSNPGYIKSSYVTSYNNSAAIDKNGNVAAVANSATHSNIDVSRQTYSYNALKNVLSVRDANALSLDTDHYRGTVVDSLLDAKEKTNVIKGSMEGDTINKKATFTKQEDALVAQDMFKALPNLNGTLKGNGDSMNLGKDDKGNLVIKSMKDKRVHISCRNADDHSINMGDILAKTSGGEALISSYLGTGVTAGSDLNLDSWDKYVHFYENDLVNGDAATEDRMWVERARDALTINTVEDAVYQDIEVPVKMLNAEITWSTTDTDYLTIRDAEDEIDVSGSGSEFAIIQVWRAKDEDKHVKITATITKGEASVTKEFDLILKMGDPSIGTIYVADAYGNVLYNGDKYIVDQYEYYREPVVKVKNGLYPDSHKLLRDSEYKVETTYMYQVDGNAKAVQVKQYTPSVAGVFTITHKITLLGYGQTQEMSYRIYTASPKANVAFEGDKATVKANRDGFAISGSPSSATGMIYAVASTSEITDLKAEDLKSQSGVMSYEFRDTYINFTFDNPNTESYNIYYALGNANGEITSKLYSAKINRVDISDKNSFKNLATKGKIGDEEPSQTIYALTKDISMSNTTFSGSKAFEGVFNGFGHKITNLSTSQYVFYKVKGGTIMNLKVDGMTIKSSTNKSGFVSECSGGDFYNIAFTNASVNNTSDRAAVLIGQVGDSNAEGGDLTISQVSVVNDAKHRIVAGIRVGGLIGFVQAYEHAIIIDNCYVVSDIEATGKGEGGGIVASWEDRTADTLSISQCYYAGQLKTAVEPGSSRLGGILGYHKGGAGVLTITKCISLAKHHIGGVERDSSVKNASPILGGYSTSQSTVVSVTACIGLMEEYNTDYEVQVFTETDLKQHPSYLTGEDYLNLDETRWTVIKADEGSEDYFKAPYVTLNFLGTWN